MKFMDRVKNGWSLAKASFEVLKLDPELMLFPAASGIALLVMLASFLIPIYAMGGDIDLLTDGKTTAGDILAYALMFIFYFYNYFVIFFFNSALISCAIVRFKGGKPTLREGICEAMASIHYILAWALVAATVGLILRAIESRGETVGRIIAAVLGSAWSILTYFVVPVVVVEQEAPSKAFKRSKKLIVKTWGETFASSFSIGVFNLLIFIVAVLPLIGGFALASYGSVVLGWCLITIGAIVMILGVLCTSALESILLAALYLYAEEGVVPEGYEKSSFTGAFVK